MREGTPDECPNGSRIRVLLADDHAMFRQGVREMLATDERIEVIGEAQNGREAVILARQENPDVVLLDVQMPVMGGAEAMEALLEELLSAVHTVAGRPAGGSPGP